MVQFFTQIKLLNVSLIQSLSEPKQFSTYRTNQQRSILQLYSKETILIACHIMYFLIILSTKFKDVIPLLLSLILYRVMDNQQRDNRLEANLPIILTPPQERQDQSQRSLFKNDSLSSVEPDKYEYESKAKGILPEIEHIRKFLKKGELLNTNTLKKLKEDVQINEIVKHDRSSVSLYKVMHTIDIPGEKQSKKAEIKRIYMSHRKQPAKFMLRQPLRKPSLASQEVQTERLQNLQQPASIQNNVDYKYHQLHKPSFVTIDIAPQQQMRTKTRLFVQNQVQQDEEENKLLPLRKSKGITGRTKALSIQQNQLQPYLQKMGKTQFTFRSSLSKPKQKFKEYQEQQTVFSKTIDVKPLLPPKDFIASFNATSVQLDNISEIKKEKVKINEFNVPSQKPSKPTVTKNTSNSIGIQYEQIQNTQVAKNNQDIKNNVLPDISRNDGSSMIPEHSDIFEPNFETKSRSIYKQAQELINRIPTGLGTRRIFNNALKNTEKKSKNKDKESIMVQVPSLHQLKVGQKEGQQKIMHPIRQNFGRSELEWMQKIYNPKNDALKNFNRFQIKKYQNGVYYGELSSQGLKHGKGVIFYFSGKVYEGELVKDMKHGKGHEYLPDGSVYRGQFKQGVKHGRGIFQWANGQIYDGQWQNGHKTGSGMWTNIQGQSYMGQWKNDKVQGFGVFVMKNGSRYEGEFKNSLKHGMGTQRFFNGETYVGNYEKNRPNGEGQYYWANGDYYKGSFLNGLRHGEGYFKQGKTKIEYTGQYQNDKKCGYGEIKYQNGMVYIGNFQNNFRHGYGQLLQNGKIKYRGYWVNDRQVDDQNQTIGLPTTIEKKKIIRANNKSVDEVAERIQSLPKPIPRKNNQVSQIKSPKHTHDHSVSPSQRGEGYKRSCGCNKNH